MNTNPQRLLRTRDTNTGHTIPKHMIRNNSYKCLFKKILHFRIKNIILPPAKGFCSNCFLTAAASGWSVAVTIYVSPPPAPLLRSHSLLRLLAVAACVLHLPACLPVVALPSLTSPSSQSCSCRLHPFLSLGVSVESRVISLDWLTAVKRWCA